MVRPSACPAKRSNEVDDLGIAASPSLLHTLLLPCGVTLQNRIAKAAMTEGLADNRNRATRAHCRLYGHWADTGAGLLITGNVQIDRRYLERPGNVAIDDVGGFEQLQAFASAGKREGSQLWMQLNHPGRQTPLSIAKTAPAPSSIPLRRAGYAAPLEMTRAQIFDVIQRFSRAATIARDAGFTGVQIHAAHGYLLSQFLSPLANARSDEWGGSLENRARILRSVVTSVRRSVGVDFPLSVKLNSSDFQNGGFNPIDCMQVARWLHDDGIDLLEISGGNYEQTSMLGSTTASSTIRREAYFLEEAKRLSLEYPGLLMVTGGFRTGETMRRALADSALDVVGMARPFITNQEAISELLQGKLVDLPLYERTLSERFASSSDEKHNRLSAYLQAWYALQILRLGDGDNIDPDLELGQAYVSFQKHEALAAKLLEAR